MAAILSRRLFVNAEVPQEDWNQHSLSGDILLFVWQGESNLTFKYQLPIQSSSITRIAVS